jgi:hypothetical protein
MEKYKETRDTFDKEETKAQEATRNAKTNIKVAIEGIVSGLAEGEDKPCAAN